MKLPSILTKLSNDFEKRAEETKVNLGISGKFRNVYEYSGIRLPESEEKLWNKIIVETLGKESSGVEKKVESS
jgi:hypothetical protein